MTSRYLCLQKHWRSVPREGMGQVQARQAFDLYGPHLISAASFEESQIAIRIVVKILAVWPSGERHSGTSCV